MNACTQEPSNSVTKSPSTELPSNPLAEIVESEDAEAFTLALLQELQFLRWFYENCDFGPAHDDVILMMMENYHAADPSNIIPEDYLPEVYDEDDDVR